MPWLEVEKIRGGRITKVIEPMFSRYLFIQLDQVTTNWGPIRSTLGVSKLVTFGNQAASISNEFARDEASMQTSNIEDNHQKNSKIIENNNVDNLIQVNSEAPANFKGKVQNKITMESFKRNEVEHRLSDTSTELTLSNGNIQSKGHKLKEERNDPQKVDQ